MAIGYLNNRNKGARIGLLDRIIENSCSARQHFMSSYQILCLMPSVSELHWPRGATRVHSILAPFSCFSRVGNCNGSLSRYRFSGAISISSFHSTVLCSTRACINKLSAFKAWHAGYSRYAMASNTRFSPLVNVTSNVCDVGLDSGRLRQCGECVHRFSLQGLNFVGRCIWKTPSTPKLSTAIGCQSALG